jgi:hypothetical protein
MPPSSEAISPNEFLRIGPKKSGRFYLWPIFPPLYAACEIIPPSERRILLSVDYGWEKFFSSLRYAVASPASLQHRLEGIVSGVYILERDNFPDDETWKRFEKLMKEATKLPARTEGEGTIRATTSQMTDDEAGHWLQEAFEIFSEIAQAYGKERF